VEFLNAIIREGEERRGERDTFVQPWLRS